jgi:hypothetical protein
MGKSFKEYYEKAKSNKPKDRNAFARPSRAHRGRFNYDRQREKSNYLNEDLDN